MSKPSRFNVPFCSDVSGSSPSAIKLLRRLKSFLTSSAIVLISCSLLSETDHAVLALNLFVTDTLTPLTVDVYAGVTVNQRCPSASSEKSCHRKYGCLKLSRIPRSSDDHRTWAPAVRAPPRKLR